MKVRRAWKFKLEPSKKQGETLFLWLSHLRGLYNLALEQRILNYQQFRKTLNYFDQANELSVFKEQETWIAEVPAQCLQQKLKDLDRAYQNFFKSGSGFPKFKKRGCGESARFPDAKQFEIRFRKGKRTSFVKLPKIGLVKFVSSQKIIGKIKNATISKQADGFYISFQSEYEIDILKNKKPAVGIDRGVRAFGVTSDAELLEIPNEKIKIIELKIERAQKKLSRKLKGSKNRSKQRRIVALLYQRISNIRKDSIHKLTNQLAKKHGVIVLEDLKIKNMTASAAGDLENPGKNVSQKSGLNRAILRQGWFEFERQLIYKLEWSGGKLLKVKPHFTSQTCFECGHFEKENREEENFFCKKCGHKNHADINAAKNILAAGHAVIDCGAENFSATKQKPNKLARVRNSRPLG